jgi:hypothetical protein
MQIFLGEYHDAHDAQANPNLGLAKTGVLQIYPP